jgi:pre-mRNA-splicing factor CWC22
MESLSKFDGYSRSGGAYLPPARLAPTTLDPSDRSSPAFQRATWEALRKSLNGLVNKVNTANIKHVVLEAFQENLGRGRGLLVKAVMRAQLAALPFTAVYAAFFAIINTKIPVVGELLVTRLVAQFKKAFRRDDKTQCIAVAMFIGHLVNHRVAHEILVLQLLMLLLENPTDDSVEIAVGLMREVGQFLSTHSPRPTNAVFERFRAILHEAHIDKRVQYMIEVLFQVRKEGFKDYLAVRPELDLVDEEDQITHHITLEEEQLDVQEGLNVFSVDPEFEKNEAEFMRLREEILGAQFDDQEEGADEAIEQQPGGDQIANVKDETGSTLINLRKVIYLTLMSSIDVDEAGHKLLKLSIPDGHEVELCNMIVECCSQERTYLKYYGLLAERFCRLNPLWEDCFCRCFSTVYSSLHKIDTARIRNITKLFGHLLETDAIPWTVFAVVRLTEEDTTASSRIFLKFLLQELAEFFSESALNQRLQDESLADALQGLFPRDTLRNVRFSIHFFEAVELGKLADGQRAFIEELEAEIAGEEREKMEREERGRSGGVYIRDQ